MLDSELGQYHVTEAGQLGVENVGAEGTGAAGAGGGGSWLDRRRLALLVYAVGMGYVEAAVVVYLREIYHPGGFSFPLAPMDSVLVGVEVGREAATLVMIAAVAWAAARSAWQLLTGFALIFGVWDIAYYIGLKAMLDWPASLTEADVLFLIPTVWVGPVLAPMVVALSMAVFAWLLWPMASGVIRPRGWEWGLMITAGLVLLGTFVGPPAAAGLTRLGNGTAVPLPDYPWWGWAPGEGLAVFVAWRWWARGRIGR